jgi:hypothetical protein
MIGRRTGYHLALRVAFGLVRAFDSGQRRLSMRFALVGLLLALLVFAVSGGHVLFLPLLFLLPLGGMFGHHRRHGHFWYRAGRRF